MKNNVGQNIVICKNCGSNEVNVTTPGANGCAAFGVGFLLICIGVWIPVIGWFVIVPIGALIALSSFIFPLFQKKYGVTCKDCEHKFYISKEQYKQYIKAVK